MAVECGRCGSSELNLVEELDDGRRRLRCSSCGNEWLRGEAKRVYKKTTTIDDLRKRFPSPDDVPPAARERADALKQRFLASHPSPRENATAFRERFGHLFSEDVLPTVPADDLKYFANANIGGNPGNMSVFNTEWNALGAEEAASRVREAIGYLLYRPEGTYIEDRLTNLIHGERGFGMKGLKEALLTKVLCMTEPQRFIPILVYTGRAGKYEVARSVFDLGLPSRDSVSWTIGRLIFWSNDLLMALVGPGFHDTEHAAEFLWWAKDVPPPGEGDQTPS